MGGVHQSGHRFCEYNKAMMTRGVFKRAGGFSLIELVMVIVVFAIAAVPLLRPLLQASEALILMDDLQTGGNLVRECAEHILSRRRNPAVGYTGINNLMCANDLPAVPPGYARDPITITDISGSGAPCPAGASCKTVTVQVDKGATTLASTTFMIVD